MAENITVNMENLTTEEREQLLALIKRSNEPACGVWKPKKNEAYWYIDGDGAIRASKGGHNEYEKNRFSIGNCFPTKEDVKFEIERLNVIRELKALTGGYKWMTYLANYFITYDTDDDKVYTAFCREIKYTNIYFKSEEAAKNAIDTIGKERLKKYYFCVE